MKQTRFLIDAKQNVQRYGNNFLISLGLDMTDNDVPIIAPQTYDGCEWIGFNYARSQRVTKGKGVHFFLEDYMFERVWNRLEVNTELLRPYDYVITPDFSLFMDFPLPMQKWNHYRKHLVGAYWQQQGLRVIPSPCWSDESSFDWCFDGEPVNAPVAVCSTGVMRYKPRLRRFMMGYDAMLERLNPSAILFFGAVPKECRGNIQKIGTIESRFKSDEI